MKVIHVKGVIIPTDYKWIYNLFGMESTSPKDITEALAESNGESIEVHINSGGGSVFAGIEMHSSLISYDGDVTIKIVGLAGSAASIIAAAGEVEIAPSGMIMIHNCSSSASGDYREMYSAGDQLLKINQAISNAYIAKTGMTQEELLELMNQETWMDAQDAIRYGFADRIMENKNGLSHEGLSGTARQMVVSNSCFEIPEETIMKIQGLLAGNSLNLLSQKGECKMDGIKNENPVNVPVTVQKPEAVTAVTGANAQAGDGMADKTTVAYGSEHTSLDDFLNGNPQAKAEYDNRMENARKEGARLETNRLKELDTISGSVPGDMLLKAKYEEPVDAKTLSFQVMREGKMRAVSYFNNAVEDSMNSGVNSIQSAVSDDSSGNEETVSADRIANSANKGRKKYNFR